MTIDFKLILSCFALFIFTIAKSQNGVGVNTNSPKSSFEDNGSFGKVVLTITGSTTLNETHASIVCNNGATPIAVTLPTANTCPGRLYEIKRNAASTALVTVTATIDGVANYLLSYANQSVTVFSDGTNWQSRDGSGDNNNWKLTGNNGTSATTNFIGTTDAIDFVTRTNGTERMRVMSGGNVGIGSTNPGSKLEVLANASGANVITSINTSASGYSSVDYKDNSSNLKFTVGYANASATNFAGKAYANTYGADFVLSRNAPNTDFFMQGSNGNIGLGNSAPQQNLSVQNGVNIDQANTNNGNTTNILTFGSGSGEGIGSKRTATGNQFGLDFYTGSSNKMAITSAGNVGVGTTAPLSLLETNGSFAKKVTNTTGNLTLTGTHSTIVCSNAAANITLTLPASNTCSGRIYDIKKDASSTGSVTLSGGGNIDGAASLVITGINTAVSIFSDGTEWKSSAGSKSLNGNAWALLGNAGTTSGTNFVGTTDAQDLVFKTNATEGARLKTSNNFFGIGTTSPTAAKLTVMSDGAGGVTQDDIALVSYNATPSPSFVFQSSKGTESAPTVLADGDDLFVIQGQPRITSGFGATTTFIRSDYKGDGSTNLSDLSIGTSAIQRVYINSSGNVGINEGTPTAKLHVTENLSGANSLPFILQNGIAGNPGNTEVSLRLSPSTTETARGVDISAIQNGGNNIDMKISLGGSASPGAPTEKIRITADGQIGIGVTTPSAYLDVDGKSNSSAIRVRGTAETVEMTDMFVGPGGNFVINNKVGTGTNSFIDLRGNDDEFGVRIRESNGTGIGAYANLFVTDGASPISDYLTITVTDPYRVDEGVHITDQGRLGIGITAPACKLDVSGTSNINYSNYGRLVQGSAYAQNTGGPTTFGISIQASGLVAASGYIATSDNRVKKEVVTLNNKNDLELLRKINLVQFKYIDTLEYSTFQNKGVIAQEIKKIIPQAVNESNKLIPNVFELSQDIVYDTITKMLTVQTSKAHDFKVGDKIRLYDSRDNLHDIEVADTPTQTSFVISDWREKSSRIFVYGKFVNDFHTVNYDYLFTTGLSAMQEMIRKQDLQEKQINNLKAENLDIKSSNIEIQNRLAEIELLLNGQPKEVTVRK